MKKNYLKFGPGSASNSIFFRAKLAPTPEGGGGVAKKKNDDEDPDNEDADDDSDEVKAIKSIGRQVTAFKKTLGDKANAEEIDQIKKDLNELKEGIASLTSKQVTDLLDKINKQNESLHKQIIELQEEANEKKEAPTSPAAKKQLVTQQAVEDFIAKTFGDKGGKGDKTKDNAKIEIKAAETFGYPTFFDGAVGTDITAFTGRFIDPTLYMRKRKRNLILDNFDIQTINVPTLVYLVKVEVGDTNPTSGDPGGADWILSGQTKPKRSFRVGSATVDAKKVAIFGTVEDKLLRDVSSLENWIREDFMLEMKEKINDGLLNNNPAINPLAPLGLKTNAVQYTPTPAFDGTIEDSTYIDALIAVFAFFIENKEEAAHAWVSSDVYYRILSLKDKNARYQSDPLIYTNSLGELYIAGVKVDWADSEDVPSDHLLVIGVDLGFKIKAYGNLVFERGLNGTDFREDKTSFRGYQEFLTYIPENRENSVLYDTWANIFAGISSPVV
jgi:hypothetical protein